jgi:hypothetical protein
MLTFIVSGQNFKPVFVQGVRPIYNQDIRALVQNHWERRAAFCTSEWKLEVMSRMRA